MRYSKIRLPYLLGRLFWTDFEGLVELTEAEIQRTIIFHNGQPVNVWSLYQEETLGRMLLEHGKIDSVEYSRLVDNMVETRKSLGELLVNMGMLKAHEVFMALEYQVQRKMLNCLKMRRFNVVLRKKKVPPDSVILKMNLAEMIYAGILNGYSRKRLAEEFPVDNSTVFSTNRSTESSQFLNAWQKKIYRSVEKKPTLNVLEKRYGLSSKLRAVLYSLHALGLVEASGIKRVALPSLDKLAQQYRKRRRSKDTSSHYSQALSYNEHKKGAFSVRDRPSGDAIVFPETSMEDFFHTRDLSPKLAERVLTLPYIDHFAVLDIDDNASEDQIRDAFYQLIETYRLRDIDSSYSKPGDIELAERLLDRATVAFRELSDLRSRAAYVKALSQNKVEKRSILPRLLSEVEALKGELALGAGQYRKAKRLFGSAIELYPVDPSNYHKLGLCGYLEFLDKNSPDRLVPASVRQPFEDALKADPSYAPSRLYLGKIMARSGELVSAVEEFEQILQAHPGHKQANELWNGLKKLLAEEQQEESI